MQWKIIISRAAQLPRNMQTRLQRMQLTVMEPSEIIVALSSAAAAVANHVQAASYAVP